MIALIIPYTVGCLIGKSTSCLFALSSVQPICCSISFRGSREPNSDIKKIRVLVTDSGKGMPKSMFKQVFKPGFTTKQRGWGLGLSLSKRIIKDYHKGRIFVKKSEINKGTTFQIVLDKV